MFLISTVVDEIPPLFCQLNLLQRSSNGDYKCWKEKRRWVRFEESAEDVLGRWSKPFVSSIPQAAMDNLKELISDCVMMLDLKLYEPKDILNQVSNSLKEHFGNESEKVTKFTEILNLPQFHHHQKKFEKMMSTSNMMNLSQLGSTIIRSDENVSHSESHTEIPIRDSFEFKENKRFKRKVHVKAEGATVLVAPVDFVDAPKLVFMRFKSGLMIPSLLELKLASRFLITIIGPTNKEAHLFEIGRAMSAVLADDLCRDLFYSSKKREEILQAVEYFNKNSMILPPSEWDPKIRIEPPEKYLSKEVRKAAPEITDYIHSSEVEHGDHADPSLKSEKRPFVGLLADLRRKLPWYASDFRDSLNVQCMAATIYMYLVSLCSLVAFGALLGQGTKNYMATMECILAGCVCGILFALFSGQPLNLLSATGPMLILEKIVCKLCENFGLDFMEFRLWIGLWIGVFLMLFVVFNLSFLVKFITRFTEDCFASLVAFMFILDAFKSLVHINDSYPMRLKWMDSEANSESMMNCSCVISDVVNASIAYVPSVKTFANCIENFGGNWSCVHLEKEYYADVFLFSVLLFILTFFICMWLKNFRESSFLPNGVRQILSDFSVLIAILCASLLNNLLEIDTPKLTVPSEFKPTRADRNWLIPFFGKNQWWSIPLAILPAIIATLLVFMDQQITAVIVNRKEFKLKKGGGYHLDLFIVASAIVFCSILGLPWFVAATVLALTHVNALKVLSENSAPGEKPTFLGVREQRVSSLVVSVLIGLSVFLTDILNYIPMPVLYAVFLFMGVSALGGLQFIDRILIVFMPAKYQPDYQYLRHVNTKKVHLFTFIQIASVAGMFIVKQIELIAICFPLLVVATCAVRKLLDYVFTQNELYWLDSLLPMKKTALKRNAAPRGLSCCFTKKELEEKDCENQNVSIHDNKDADSAF